MTIIGSSEIEIRPNTDSFASDLKDKVGNAMKNPLVVAGAAVAAVGATVTAFAKSSVDKFQEVGGEVKKLVTATGDSAESMSRLRFAAHETGVSTDSLGVGIKKLSTYIVKNHDDLDKLGIKYKDTKGKLLPMDQTLGNIAEKFKTMPNGVQKNALAIQLFGRSGTDLIPILNKGKDGMAALGAEADKFGLTLTQKNLDAIKRNAEAHREFSAAVDGLKVQVGSFLLPAMTDLAEFVNSKAIPAITSITEYVDKTMGPKFSELTGKVSDAYNAFVNGFSDGSAVQTNLDSIGQIFSGLGATVKGIFDDGKTAYGAFVDGFKDNSAVTDEVGGLATAFAGLGVAVRDALGFVKDIAEQLAKHPAIVKAATEAIAGFYAAYKVIDFGKKTIDLVVNGVDKALDVIGKVAQSIANITGDKVVNVVANQGASGAAGGAAKSGGGVVGEQAGNIVSGAAGGALGNFFDLKALTPKIKVLAGGIIGALGEALIAAAGGLAEVGAAIVAFIFSPAVLIAAAVAAVAVIAFHFRKGLVDFFANKLPKAIEDVVKALPSFGDSMKKIGGDLIQGLLDGILDGLKFVLDAVADIPNNIAYTLGFLGGLLFRAGKDLIQGLWDGATFIFDQLKKWVSDIGQNIFDLLDLAKTIYDKGKDLITGFFGGITDFWTNTVQPFISNIPGAVVGFVGDVARTLYDKGKDLLGGLWDGIQLAWNDPKQFFIDLAVAIPALIGATVKWLYDKGRDIIGGLKDGISDVYDSALKYFRDLRDKVLNAVSNAKDWLIEAGKDIIRGLVNGIGQLYDSAVGKMKSLGGSIIDGFKKGAGIGSPSRFMHESGVFLMKGLANGIDAGRQMALDAINDVASAVLDPFSSPMMAGLPSGLGRSGSGARVTHIENLTIQNSKTLQENLDEVDRLALPL